MALEADPRNHVLLTELRNLHEMQRDEKSLSAIDARMEVEKKLSLMRQTIELQYSRSERDASEARSRYVDPDQMEVPGSMERGLYRASPVRLDSDADDVNEDDTNEVGISMEATRIALREAADGVAESPTGAVITAATSIAAGVYGYAAMSTVPAAAVVPVATSTTGWAAYALATETAIANAAASAGTAISGAATSAAAAAPALASTASTAALEPTTMTMTVTNAAAGIQAMTTATTAAVTTTAATTTTAAATGTAVTVGTSSTAVGTAAAVGGTSMMATVRPLGRLVEAKPRSIVKPRSCSSAKRSGLVPVRAMTKVDLP